MKKVLKWILGMSAQTAFFVLDDSGIGIRKHLQSVMDYADGRAELLLFC